MQHLFAVWQEIADRLLAARQILLLSDYDGTLTPIVERPELANLPDEIRSLLRQLSRQHGLKAGIISGRALTDLRQKVGLSGIIYAGNHGLEIEGPGINFIHPLTEEVKPLFRLIHRVLDNALGTIQGVFVENKGLTLSVHYRQVEDHQTETVKNVFERILAGARSLGTIRITAGKKVLEVRPSVKWNKGKAVQLIMKRYGKGGSRSGVLPVYLGDDLTDEDAFVFVEKYGGISVFVGEENRPTAASYFLRSPGEVADFLKLMLQLV